MHTAHAKKKREERPPRLYRDGRLLRGLLADRVSCAVEFLIQHALFVAGQATAMLRGHVVRFLPDHVEAMVQRAALWRRVIALIHAVVDPAAEIVDAAVDLTQALIRDLLRVGTRRRLGLRRHHTGGEGTEQGARGERADSTGHGLSGSHCRCVVLPGSNG